MTQVSSTRLKIRIPNVDWIAAAAGGGVLAAVPLDGRVTFDGQSLTGLAPHRIVNRGLARTFQLARPFVDMSVAENIEVACLAPRVSHSGRPRERAHALAEQVGLGDKAEPDVEVEIFQGIRAVQQAGVAVLLVEQDARSALAVAERVYVLEHGRIAVKALPGNFPPTMISGASILGFSLLEP